MSGSDFIKRKILIVFCVTILFIALNKSPGFCQDIKEVRDTLKEAVVHADMSLTKKDIGYKWFDKEMIDNGFALFCGPDIIKTLQNQPGVSSGLELLSGLYVHGGDGTDNIFLLDGVPIYQTGHLGGVFSTFNGSPAKPWV